MPGELNRFREVMLAADPKAAIAAIRDFLATGQDALTGERFEIGPGGVLTGAPTYRVLLLDLLGRISREHQLPDGGLMGRALLEKKSSADEWAIALRNVGWATPSDTDYLAAKATDLLRYQPWKMQPTAGYYEAFDVIVFTRSVALIPDLAEMVRSDDGDAKTTAATTLDRLAAMAPLDVMRFLNSNPAELSDKPFLRSDYYTKANFTQAGQRAAVEAYLDRPDVAEEAKAKVIATLGAPGIFVSDNLLTETPDAPAEDIPVAEKNALVTAFGDWLKSNRYPPLTQWIQARQDELKSQ